MNWACRLAGGLSLSAILTAAGCGACEPEPQPLVEAASEAAGQAAPSFIRPAPGPISDRGATRFRASCHAIAVDGEVTVGREGEATSRPDAGPAVVASNSEVPNESWLALAPGARLVVRDPRSGREVTFKGPARARACVASEEEAWVSRGRFESTAGSGEAPGAEEWIVTALGVLRFGAARLAVDVDARGARAEITSGTAFVWLPPDTTTSPLDGGGALKADAEGWARVGSEGIALRPKVERPALLAARSAVAACVGLARSARKLAVALLEREAAREREAGEGRVALAAQQVSTRRLARAACATAGLRVADLPDAPGLASAVRESLTASLLGAGRDWSELPLESTPERR